MEPELRPVDDRFSCVYRESPVPTFPFFLTSTFYEMIYLWVYWPELRFISTADELLIVGDFKTAIDGRSLAWCGRADCSTSGMRGLNVFCDRLTESANGFEH